MNDLGFRRTTPPPYDQFMSDFGTIRLDPPIPSNGHLSETHDILLALACSIYEAGGVVEGVTIDVTKVWR